MSWAPDAKKPKSPECGRSPLPSGGMGNDYSDLVQRAALPEILFAPDVGTALGLTVSAARKAILRGDCGPYLRIGRRLAVRRDSFLAALRELEIDPRAPLPYLAVMRRGASGRARSRRGAEGRDEHPREMP